MAWFKKKVKEDEKHMTTLEEVRKAYEDLSDDDKKTFHQSIADRVHESIAAQERADGDEDSQSAEAREHEALGEEHAEGNGETQELHETDDSDEEKREDKNDDNKYDNLMSRIEALEKRLEATGDNDEQAARESEKVYGVGNGVFATARKDEEKITPKEAAQITRSLKI